MHESKQDKIELGLSKNLMDHFEHLGMDEIVGFETMMGYDSPILGHTLNKSRQIFSLNPSVIHHFHRAMTCFICHPLPIVLQDVLGQVESFGDARAHGVDQNFTVPSVEELPGPGWKGGYDMFIYWLRG